MLNDRKIKDLMDSKLVSVEVSTPIKEVQELYLKKMAGRYLILINILHDYNKYQLIHIVPLSLMHTNFGLTISSFQYHMSL